MINTKRDRFEKYQQLDSDLVAEGFPPTSPFWMRTLERFLHHPTAWRLIARVGRRGGKSSTLCRLAVLLALEEWPIPPGDVGFVLFISARTEDARARLTTIEAILRALLIPFTTRDATIHINGRPIAFRVIPATIAAASGPTSILVIADEESKWRDADTGANPATEVLATARPTLATMRKHGALMVESSSPFGVDDAHARAFDLGDTDSQIVAFAETWIANPTLTEEETHALEPDPKRWLREYAAIPSASASSAFETDDIAAAFRPLPSNIVKADPVLVVDPSDGRGDAFTWAAVRWVMRLKPGTPVTWRCWFDDSRLGRQTIDREYTGEGVPDWAFTNGDRSAPQFYWPVLPSVTDANVEESILLFEEIGAVDKFAATEAGIVADKIKATAKRWGIRKAYGDQRGLLWATAELGRRGIAYTAIAWVNETKRLAVEQVRRWMGARTLILPEHERMRAELFAFESKITPSGYETYAGRRSGHDDHVALLLTAAIAESHGFLPHSPLAKRAARGTVRHVAPGVGEFPDGRRFKMEY